MWLVGSRVPKHQARLGPHSRYISLCGRGVQGAVAAHYTGDFMTDAHSRFGANTLKSLPPRVVFDSALAHTQSLLQRSGVAR